MAGLLLRADSVAWGSGRVAVGQWLAAGLQLHEEMTV